MAGRATAQNRIVWLEKNQTRLHRYDAVIEVLEEGYIGHPARKKEREGGHG